MRSLAFISVLALAACAQQDGALSQSEGPVAPAATEAPKAPHSAADILRIEDINFASFSPSLAKFVGIELGESDKTAIPKIEAYFTPQGGSVEDAMNKTSKKTETEFSTFGAEGGKVTLVERVNMRDDSVKAEQFYAIFKAEGDDFILADYGMKIKCHRSLNGDGNTTTSWQTELCP